MKVRDLIEELENFDGDMEVIIGMQQDYGDDCNAVVITQRSQCGAVNYDGEHEIKLMTSKEKIKDILDWIQSTTCSDWNFLQCLKQDLECLATIAKTEGIENIRNALGGMR